jgi:hypothetical protein
MSALDRFADSEDYIEFIGGKKHLGRGLINAQP